MAPPGGIVCQQPAADAIDVELRALFGTLPLRRLGLVGFGTAVLPSPRVLRAGETLPVRVRPR